MSKFKNSNATFWVVFKWDIQILSKCKLGTKNYKIFGLKIKKKVYIICVKIEVKYINAYAEITKFYDGNESADKNLYNFSPFFTLIKNGQKNSFEFQTKKAPLFYRMIHFNAKNIDFFVWIFVLKILYFVSHQIQQQTMKNWDEL